MQSYSRDPVAGHECTLSHLTSGGSPEQDLL